MERPEISSSLNITPEEETRELIEFDASRAMNLDAIEALRADQLIAYKEAKDVYARNGLSTSELEKVTHTAVRAKIATYLHEQGLAVEDPRYSVFSDALNDLSVTNSYQSTWKKGSTENAGESGEEKAEMYYKSLVEQPANTGGDIEETDPTEQNTESPEEEPSQTENASPELIAEQEKLAVLREKLATLSAKRQGRVTGSGGKKYEAALQAYNEQAIKVNKLQSQAVVENETASEAEKKATVVMNFLKEQNTLRESATDKLKHTVVGKFVSMMTSGNIAQRIAKGIAFGAGASLLAAGAGVVIGIAGGAALVGGATAGIVALGRFAKGYAVSDANKKEGKGRGMQMLDDVKYLEQAYDSVPTGSVDYFEAIQKYYSNTFEADTEKEQRKRLKSVGAGVLGIVLGTGIGFGIQAAADANLFDGWGNRGLSLPGSNNEVSAQAPPAGTEPALPDGGDYNGDGVVDSADTPDTTPPAEVADIYDGQEDPISSDYSGAEGLLDANFDVSYGEGGIHFFQDMGLTEANWYEVQQDLLNQFPNDFYPMDGGNVGLSHTGPLSLEAQQYIKTRFNMP